MHDLQPESIKQLDFTFIFKSFNVEKLQKLYDGLDLSVPFLTFLEMYKYATKVPYSFFYIDCRNDRFRKNFSEEIIPEIEDDD